MSVAPNSPQLKIFFASGGPLRRPRYIDFVTKVIHWQCPRNQSSSVSEEYLWSILLADGIGNSVQCVCQAWMDASADIA